MGWWNAFGKVRRAIPLDPLTKSELAVVLRGDCLCGGVLERAAYRLPIEQGRNWQAFGYRCAACHTVYMDDQQ